MVTRLSFPFFGAVAGLWFAPDYLTRERQEFKEEGKPQVSLPFCPSRGRGSLPRSAERNSPLRFSKKTAARQGRTACTVRVPRSAGAEKTPARQGRTACAVRVPRSAGAEKTAARQGRTACAVRVPQRVGAGKQGISLDKPEFNSYTIKVNSTNAVKKRSIFPLRV